MKLYQFFQRCLLTLLLLSLTLPVAYAERPLNGTYQTEEDTLFESIAINDHSVVMLIGLDGIAKHFGEFTQFMNKKEEMVLGNLNPEEEGDQFAFARIEKTIDEIIEEAKEESGHEGELTYNEIVDALQENLPGFYINYTEGKQFIIIINGIDWTTNDSRQVARFGRYKVLELNLTDEGFEYEGASYKAVAE